MQEKTKAIVERHPLFRRLPLEAKSALLSIIVEETVEANTLIYQEQAQGDSLYVVVSGSVLLQRDVAGSPVPMIHLQAGESFGELALLAPGPRLLTAKAVSAGVVARLSAGAIQSLDEQFPHATLAIRARVLDHFLIKIRHLQPMWQAMLEYGLRVVDDPLSRK